MSVAQGHHSVPNGVAVEELDGGKKKLSQKCPPELESLLERNGARPIYDRLVEAIVKEGSTRNVFGMWRDKEFDGILDLFREELADKSVKVALCKRKSGSGTFRWLEFIDMQQAPDYVPQFDVANLSGQVIKTCYSKLEFPNGVVAEELRRYGKAKKKLREGSPIFVEKMMQEKDLIEEYTALIDDICNADFGSWKKWDIKKVDAIVKAHDYKFEKKGVALFVCLKEEYVSHGQYGGHMEIFRWIEFVDRSVQPNYFPQRDVDSKMGGK